jgi:hypothetical protein
MTKEEAANLSTYLTTYNNVMPGVKPTQSQLKTIVNNIRALSGAANAITFFHNGEAYVTSIDKYYATPKLIISLIREGTYRYTAVLSQPTSTFLITNNITDK